MGRQGGARGLPGQGPFSQPWAGRAWDAFQSRPSNSHLWAVGRECRAPCAGPGAVNREPRRQAGSQADGPSTADRPSCEFTFPEFVCTLNVLAVVSKIHPRLGRGSSGDSPHVRRYEFVRLRDSTTHAPASSAGAHSLLALEPHVLGRAGSLRGRLGPQPLSEFVGVGWPSWAFCDL